MQGSSRGMTRGTATASAPGTLTGQDHDDAGLAGLVAPLGALLTALAIALLVIFLRQFQPIFPGTHVPSQDGAHSSSPPTSGPRVDRLPDRYVLRDPLDPAEQVNILAYGNILIQYNDPCLLGTAECLRRGSEDFSQDLAALARLYDNEPVGLNLRTGHGVVVAPSADVAPGQIVVTAWTRELRLDTFDRRAIERFIEAWMGDRDRAGK
jgi:Protein of unknown function (DUF3105)